MRFEPRGADVGCGAQDSAVPFADALFTWVSRGAPTGHEPAVRATERIRTAGAYLDCRRARPDLVPELQAQADMALRHFAREGNVKWASLLVWAGADPRSLGPAVESGDDPELFTTALREACAAGQLDVLKRPRPDPARDDLDGSPRGRRLLRPRRNHSVPP
jgi:hypothetical protein